MNTQTEKTVVWAGGGWGVGTETDQPVLLLYHLGRESWHGIRRHPASLAQHCRLRAKHPPLCSPLLLLAGPAWLCPAQQGSWALSKIARPHKARGCLQVCTCMEDKWLDSGASTCTYTLKKKKTDKETDLDSWTPSFLLQFQCFIKLHH